MKKLLLAGALFVATAGAVFFLPAQEHVLPWTPPTSEAVRVLFVGDIMLDRNVARSAEAEGVSSLFSSSTLALFGSADLRIANLEGTITNNASLARQNNKILRFTFKPQTAEEVLTLLKLDAVSLANNHALDFGEFGYDETLDRVEALGVRAFGQPFNDKGRLSTSVSVGEKNFCFVGFHALFNDDIGTVMSEIAQLHSGGTCFRIVVVPHWGEEYETRSTVAQQEAAHAFIDAGADLVIGAHPHVVQEVETYKGKAIFYSLGNFMFDQNFSWETTHGLAVLASFEADITRFSLIPMVIQDQHSSVAVGEDRARILTIAGVADFTLP